MTPALREAGIAVELTEDAKGATIVRISKGPVAQVLPLERDVS